MHCFSRPLVRIATLAVFVAISSTDLLCQEARKEPSGSISGRVTVGDKPVPRAVVMLMSSAGGPIQRGATLRATTDEDGRYSITGIAGGNYVAVPFTPALVLPSEGPFGQSGKSVTLADDEQVEGIDFSLTKGGVITGRVTDADGRPIVEQRINVLRVDENSKRIPTTYFNIFGFQTDDRGVYRLFGLTPGLYKLSVGDAPDSGTVRIGFGGGSYPRTFHPDVSDESKATVVEVGAGGEAADIDIKVGRASKTFVATGRVVDADTGKPVPNLQYGHGPLRPNQTNVGSFGWTGNVSGPDGEFRIEGLAPGRYAAFTVATEQVEFYSEPAVFDVNDADVKGLEIKVKRGASIGGLAAVEGLSDNDPAAQLPKLELRAFVISEQVSAPAISAAIPVGPDGSFLITGLKPGKVRISLGGISPPKGYALLRVERDGMEQRDGIEVKAGETVLGVRVVLGYGTGIVRGVVVVKNGQLAPDARLRVVARKLDGQGPAPSTVVDARGRFVLEGLIPGTYELRLAQMIVTPAPPGAPPPPGRSPPGTLGTQNVTVSNGTETEVTLVVDLGSKDKESDKESDK